MIQQAAIVALAVTGTMFAIGGGLHFLRKSEEYEAIEVSGPVELFQQVFINSYE